MVSISPGEVGYMHDNIFSKINHGKADTIASPIWWLGAGMSEYKMVAKMRQFAPMHTTHYCFSVAFYGEKLDSDNFLQV